LVALLIAVACQAPEDYFEPGVLCPEYPDVDDLMREFSSLALAAMNEPSLLPSCQRGERVCRFLWLRSFDAPVAVRLAECSEGLTGTVTILAGTTGDDPLQFGPIETRRQWHLPNTSWDELARRVDAAGFWTAPPYSEEEIFVADGATWILELCDGHRRRVVIRKSPEENGPFHAYRELCLTMLRWAGLRWPADQVY
jgi:hypothetical protein